MFIVVTRSWYRVGSRSSFVLALWKSKCWQQAQYIIEGRGAGAGFYGPPLTQTNVDNRTLLGNTVLQFYSLFIYMPTQQPKGQL
jgi:hypothetical protein